MTSVSERRRGFSARQATAVVAIIIALVAIAGWLSTARPARIQDQANMQHARAVLAQLPMAFEPNVGQTDQRVKYVARGNGYTVFLTGQEAVLRLKKAGVTQDNVVSLKFAGTNPAKTESLDRQRGVTNYYDPSDPSRTHEKIPNYGAVRYHGIYPGVDAALRGNQGNFRYDYLVQPGADPGVIRLSIGGVDNIKLAANGDLVMNGGALTQQKPVIYQEKRGTRQPVDGGYVLLADNQVGFRIGNYDRSRELVIDPTFVFGAYVGGTGIDEILGVAQNATQLFIVGDTNSAAFPTGRAGSKPGASSVDAFVIGMDRGAVGVNFRTFFGGSGVDVARGVALGADGGADLYVVGDTTTLNIATTYVVQNGGAPANLTCAPNGANGQEAFVLVVDQVAGAIAAGGCQYIGANNATTYGRAIVSDGGANIWVGGDTTSAVASTTGGTQFAYQGGASDGYVTKLTAAAGPTLAINQSTMIGGGSTDRVNALTLMAGGTVVLAAGTTNSDASAAFPTTTGSFQQAQPAKTVAGTSSGFVVGLNSTLIGAPVFGTFFGGNGIDTATAITVDSAGNAYFAGSTTSTNLPGAFFGSLTSGQQQSYVARLTTSGCPLGPPCGNLLPWSGYIGGNGTTDTATGIAVDPQFQAYVVGTTNATNLLQVYSPSTGANPLQTVVGGTSAAYLARLNPGGAGLNYLGFDGQTGANSANAIALDVLTSPKTAFFAGSTNGNIQASAATPPVNAPQGFTDGFLSALLFNDLTVSPGALAFTVNDGTPVAASLTTTLTQTAVGVPPVPTFGAIAYSCGTNPAGFTGNCSTLWLKVPVAGDYNAGTGVLSVYLTAAANTLQAGNYKASFTVIGPYDNNPQTLNVTLTVNQTLTSSSGAAVVRTFQKNAPTAAVGGTGGANVDTFTVTVPKTPAEAYTATLAFDSAAAACNNQGAWISGVTPVASPTGVVTPASTGTAFTITYNAAILQSMDLTSVETSPLTPACTAHVTLSTPNNANIPSVTVAVTMNFTSRLIPSIAGTPLLYTAAPTSTVPVVFNFSSPTDAAQAKIVTVQGDGLAIHFNTPVVNSEPGCFPAVTVSPISAGPPYLAPDADTTGVFASFSITANPVGCANNTSFSGASGSTVTLTPTGGERSATTVIPITLNVGNVLTASTGGSPVFTGPALGGNVADTPTGYPYSGYSVATDLLATPPTSNYSVVIGDVNPASSFPFNLNVSTLAAVGAGCTRVGAGPVSQVAVGGTGVTADWFTVTPSSSTAGNGAAASTLTFSVVPLVWSGMQATANGCTYTGTVFVSSASAGGSPSATYSVNFTKVLQPVQTSAFNPALTSSINNLPDGRIKFQGIVGQGLLAPQAFTVTTPNPLEPMVTLDGSTAPLATTSYAGYNYPNRANLASLVDTDGGVFLGGVAVGSWLRVPSASVNATGGAIINVSADTTNLTPSPSQLVPGSGTCPAGTLFVNTVVPNQCMTPYTGVVRLRGGTSAGLSYSGQNVVEIPVSFVVVQAPALTLSSSQPTGSGDTVAFSPFTVLSGASIASQSLTVSSTSTTVSLPYTAVLGSQAGFAGSCAGATLFTLTAPSGGVQNTTTSIGGTATGTAQTVGISASAACAATLLPGTYSTSLLVNSPTAAVPNQNLTVSLQVLAAPVISSVPPAAAVFTATAGGPVPTTGQSFTINYSGASTFTAAFAPTTGGAWLSVSPTTAQPGGTTISAVLNSVVLGNPVTLAPGTYTGNINITDANTANSVFSIPVTLTVSPSSINQTPTSLSFAYTIGGTLPGAQSIAIAPVPSTLTVTATGTVTTPAGGTWLPATFTVIGNSISVAVTPTGLAPSLTPYAGFITLTAIGAPTQVIPVSFLVNASSIQATTNALSFGYTVGGTLPANQTIAVSTTPSGLTVTPAVTVTTPSGGSWLGASLASGVLTVTATPGTLAPNATPYAGFITLSANGAPNLVIPVSFLVTQGQIFAVPGSLTFTEQNPGNGSPAAQTVAVTTNPTGLAVSSSYAVATPAGGTWLSASLSGGVLTVTATTGSLGNGSYSGSVTLTATGAQNVVIPVTFNVGAVAVISVNPSTTATFAGVINNLAPPAAQSLLVTVQNGPVPLTLTGAIPTWLNATLVPNGVATSTASLNLSINQSAVNSLPVGAAAPVTLTIGSSQAGIASVVVTVNLNVSAITISASPSTWSLAYTLGGSTATQTQTVTLTGTAGTVFNYSIPSSGCGFLTAAQLSGTLPAQVVLTVAGPGSSTVTQGPCAVTFGVPGNSATAATSVTMNIYPQPVVTQPATATYNMTWQGAVPAGLSLPVTITNASSVTGSMLATSGSCGWLTVPTGALTFAGSIATSINAAGLPAAPGSYTCTLTLSGGTGMSAVAPSAPALYPNTTVVTLNIAYAPFFVGSAYPTGSSMLLLQFPDGTAFGYYVYTGGNWIYHLDLGYEYVVPANDASNGVYMFDLKSGHWFYTNPGSFPYLYDFTLKAWLYYFPSQTLPNRYLSGPRWFANMTTGISFQM